MNWLNKIPQGTELNDFLEDDNTRCRACGCLLFVAKKPKKTKKDAEVQDDED
jgi:hypothetical protein